MCEAGLSVEQGIHILCWCHCLICLWWQEDPYGICKRMLFHVPLLFESTAMGIPFYYWGALLNKLRTKVCSFSLK